MPAFRGTSSPGLAVDRPQHSLPQGVADEEVCFGIAKLVVTVTRVGGLLGLAHELVRRDEDDLPANLRTLRHGGLRLANRIPRAFRLHPWSGELTDDHRQVRSGQIFADVAD